MISLREFESAMSSNRKIDKIEDRIHLIRGERVMLDFDLAKFYGVTTKRLNEQVKRNHSRFPEGFAFQLRSQELIDLRSQIATSSLHGGRRYFPWAFTEHGALMLASVLNSKVAIRASILIVQAFVRLRRMIAANVQLSAKLKELERRVDSHDQAIGDLFSALQRLLEPPEAPKKREIGFHVREKTGRYRANPRGQSSYG